MREQEKPHYRRLWPVPYQPNSAPPQNASKGPLMVIYKKLSTLCYISKQNRLQNKIFWLQTQFWQNQARSQVLRFVGQNTSLWGKDFNFYHMLTQMFLSITKFGGHKKDFGITAPECSPCLRAWAAPSPESLPLRTFMFVQGARHSENLILIHNMNSICRLCKLFVNIFPQIRITGS